MNDSGDGVTVHLRGSRKLARGTTTACLTLAALAGAQDPALLTNIEKLGLDTFQAGSIRTYFSPGHVERAAQLSKLTGEVADFYEHELGVSFPVQLAVLAPEHWLTPGGQEEPYGMPWASHSDRLIGVPASLEEGVLILGPNDLENRRRVDFVALHEFGHLAAKEYFHPASDREFSPVWWFEELVATYFAYAFVRPADPEWEESLRRGWDEVVEGHEPAELSLDWSFMKDLPPDGFAQTYAWYQCMLNLRVAELYAEHGLDFVRVLRETLPWNSLEDWTTASLLEHLDKSAPGFQEWAGQF